MKKKLIELLKNVPDDTKCPQEYIDKYNTNGEREIPGGRAWVMWFLDFAEEKGVLDA